MKDISAEELLAYIESLKSKQKIDNGHDCYDVDCHYCENAIKDDILEDIENFIRSKMSEENE